MKSCETANGVDIRREGTCNEFVQLVHRIKERYQLILMFIEWQSPSGHWESLFCHFTRKVILPEEKMMESNVSYADFGLVKLDESQVPQISSFLAKAYYDYPMSHYFFPNDKKRMRQLKTLFSLLSYTALSQGTIVSNNEDVDGVAMLLDGENSFVTDGTFLKGVFKLLPGLLSMGLPTLLRLSYLDNWATKKRRELAPDSHIYFFVLGVDPDYPSNRVALKLLQKSAKYFDAVKMPCYYETYIEKNARHYGVFGCEMIYSSDVPKTNLTCWAGVRTPR